MKFIEVLAVCFFACPQSAPEPAVKARSLFPVEYKAECTLTPELVDQIIADLASEERKEAAVALLDEHEIEHGWSTGLSGPDFVDPAHAVRCSDGVLARMASLRPSSTPDVSPWDLHRPFAIALQRAGRMKEALAILDAAIAAPVDENDVLAKMVASSRTSWLNEIAAVLCARVGKPDRAFEYAKHWTSTSWCGNCAVSENDEIQTFRASQLALLGRNDEAIAIACEMACDSWSTPSAQMLAACIDCEIKSHRCADAACAVELLQSECRRHAAAVADVKSSLFVSSSGGMANLHSGKRLWELQQASREVQLASLGEIVSLDYDFAVSLVFGFDNRVVGEHLDAFEINDGHMRDPSLACVLARTGNPILEPALDRAAKALGEKEMDYERDLWNSAHARWVALSRPR